LHQHGFLDLAAAIIVKVESYNRYVTVVMAEAQDLHHSTASHQDGFEDEESLSPLEQEVLDEYARLLGNLNNVRTHTHTQHSCSNHLFFPSSPSSHDSSLSSRDRLDLLLTLHVQMSALLAELSDAPSAAMLDGLRGLERKTSLVFTLLKASVYSIVLNQQIQDNGQEPGEGQGSEGEGEGWGH
jgi:DASH complex subunit DAD3